MSTGEYGFDCDGCEEHPVAALPECGNVTPQSLVLRKRALGDIERPVAVNAYWSEETDIMKEFPDEEKNRQLFACMATLAYNECLSGKSKQLIEQWKICADSFTKNVMRSFGINSENRACMIDLYNIKTEIGLGSYGLPRVYLDSLNSYFDDSMEYKSKIPLEFSKEFEKANQGIDYNNELSKRYLLLGMKIRFLKNC